MKKKWASKKSQESVAYSQLASTYTDRRTDRRTGLDLLGW